MQTDKKKAIVWGIFALYMFIVVEIILVKHPRFFLWRMVEIFYRHHFQRIGVEANFRPFRTIKQLLFVDFNFITALLNIGGNILLFIPLGIFLPFYFKAPFKKTKTIIICFLLSSFFECFQLLTSCGFFDVDDIFLNTLGGIVGLYIYTLFIKHSNYSQKKLVVSYVPNQFKLMRLTHKKTD